MEREAEVFEHRGVPVSAVTLWVEVIRGLPSPLMQDGKMVSYYAVAGNYGLVCNYAANPDGIKGLIDSVLDRKVKLAPLAGNTLGTFSVKAESLEKMFPGHTFGGMYSSDLKIELSKANGRLVLKAVY